jgi:hypothetical protein
VKRRNKNVVLHTDKRIKAEPGLAMGGAVENGGSGNLAIIKHEQEKRQELKVGHSADGQALQAATINNDAEEQKEGEEDAGVGHDPGWLETGHPWVGQHVTRVYKNSNNEVKERRARITKWVPEGEDGDDFAMWHLVRYKTE